MKGVVFTEFLEMVEDRFSIEAADSIIEEAEPASGGAYTAVGTYDHGELINLVGALSGRTGVPVPDLVKTYGEHLFGRFSRLYPKFFDGVGSSFDFLQQIEDYIHVEVRKLYPDAELPRFETESLDEERMVLVYRSPRPFADFAEGLIAGCIAHFEEDIDCAREDLANGDGTGARFVLTRRA